MRTTVIVFSLTLFTIACGPKPEGQDGGTQEQDAGCQLDGGDSFFKGVYLDAGVSVEYEQQCSKAPNPLRTGLAVGGFCTIAERCAQHACTCAAGEKRYAARACDALCQDAPTACAWAVSAEPALCQ